MQVGRSGKPGSAPIIEVWEMLGAMFDTAGSIASPRAFYQHGQDGATISILYVLAGGSAPTHTQRNGLTVRQFSAGLNLAAVATLKFALPLSRNVSAYPASFRPQRRYLYETVVERTVPLVAAHPMQIGVKDDPGNELASVNDHGLVIESRSTVNAGRWTLLHKASGGGVVQGADSGVAPGGLQHIAFEFFDTIVPSLNIYINGVRVITVPAATLATINPSVNEPMCFDVQSGGNPSPVGQVDFQYDTHLLIQSL